MVLQNGMDNFAVAPPQGGYSSTEIWIELEFGNVGFLRRGENWSTRRKTSRNREENQV